MANYEALDIPSAKERFIGNEALYKKFLYRFPDDTVMDNLLSSLEKDDLEQAFKDAHTMKGMVGNLSLYKLMAAASDVTEELRAKKRPSEEQMEVLKKEYEEAVSAIREIEEQDVKLF